MILIPIGHEEDTVRRLPWVTFTVIAICLGTLLLTAGTATEERLNDQARQAIEFYLEHPHLKPDPEFLELTGLGDDDETAQAFVEAMAGTATSADDALRAEQQAHLDRLITRALDSRTSHPFLRFGLVPSRPSLLAFLTHMFLHAGWLHLLGNMFLLYLAGPYIEDAWGRPLFLGFYLLSGIAAALTFMAPNLEVELPLVGASGAIAGVMGAFMVRFRNTRIRFFYMLGLIFRGTFTAPAWFMLSLWLGQQLFFASLTSGSAGSGGVAYSAHIGGFLFGVGAALLIHRQRFEERFIHAAIEGKIEETVLDNSAVERALDAHQRGEPRDAWKTLTEELRRNPGNLDAVEALWTVAEGLGFPANAAPDLLRAIQGELRTGNPGSGLRHWNELNHRLPDLKVDATCCVRIAGAQLQAGQDEQGAVTLRRGLLVAGSAISPALALRIARLGRKADPALAAGALRVALAQGNLDPESRNEMEQLLGEIDRTGIPVSS